MYKTMRKLMRRSNIKYAAIVIVLIGLFSIGLIWNLNSQTADVSAAGANSQGTTDKSSGKTDSKEDAKPMPVYGHWRNFTTKDGLPSDKAYCVRIDGDRVLVGTHDGLLFMRMVSGVLIHQKMVWPIMELFPSM
jgi:hypothetical protein